MKTLAAELAGQPEAREERAEALTCLTLNANAWSTAQDVLERLQVQGGRWEVLALQEAKLKSRLEVISGV